jgi:hypothetical protein
VPLRSIISDTLIECPLDHLPSVNPGVGLTDRQKYQLVHHDMADSVGFEPAVQFTATSADPDATR